MIHTSTSFSYDAVNYDICYNYKSHLYLHFTSNIFYDI